MTVAGVDAERLLATFLDLARIANPSGCEARCAAYCADALIEAGCEVRFDQSAGVTGSDTGNLIARLPGTVPGTLLLSAHLDSVEPCDGVVPVVEDGVIRSAGDTILGADDKAGLAAAIECVRVLATDRGPRPDVVCVFTVQEEVGLRGAKALDADDLAADLCLVLDADGAPGGIVTAAPTHCTFAALFSGRAAHAGVAPEAGVSAMRMAAAAIMAMPAGRVDAQSTANVGTIKGGAATNVITPSVEITGECRSLDRERVEALRSSMEDAMKGAAEREGGTVDVRWTLEYEGFTIPADSPQVSLVMRACVDAGLTPRLFVTGGGSDANVLASAGLQTVALSCGMEGVHGTSESIEVANLTALAELCVAVARHVGRGA